MEALTHLRSQRGEFAFRWAVGLLAASILFFAGLSIWHVYHVVGKVREKVDEAVLAVAAVNVSEFYGGARETDGYARHMDGDDFAVQLDTQDVLNTLARSVGGSLAADGTITVDGSYVIRTLAVRYENREGSILRFRAILTVAVPLELGGMTVPIEKTIKVCSGYDTKF